MSERTFQYPPTVVRKVTRMISSATAARGALAETIPAGQYDFHNPGSHYLKESGPRERRTELEWLVGFEGKPVHVAFTPEDWVTAILTGDCVDHAAGEMIAYYTKMEMTGSQRTFRIALEMNFADAIKILSLCAVLAELPAHYLGRRVSERLGEPTPISLRDSLSPDGFPPFAPHLVRFI